MLLLKIFLARPWFLVYIYKCAGGSPLVQKGRREKLGCLGCLGCVGTLLVSSVAAEAAIREWKVWEFSQQCKNPPEISPTDFFVPICHPRSEASGIHYFSLALDYKNVLVLGGAAEQVEVLWFCRIEPRAAFAWYNCCGIFFNGDEE